MSGSYHGDGERGEEEEEEEEEGEEEEEEASSLLMSSQFGDLHGINCVNSYPAIVRQS